MEPSLWSMPRCLMCNQSGLNLSKLMPGRVMIEVALGNANKKSCKSLGCGRHSAVGSKLFHRRGVCSLTQSHNQQGSWLRQCANPSDLANQSRSPCTLHKQQKCPSANENPALSWSGPGGHAPPLGDDLGQTPSKRVSKDHLSRPMNLVSVLHSIHVWQRFYPQ